MNKEIQDCILKFQQFFPKSFIYKDNELIVEPKNNIYFRIDNISTEFEFRCKVVSWVSRPTIKGVSDWHQVRIRNSFNKFLGTEFTIEELTKIYTYVGCDCNKKKLLKFVKSGYDLSLL